MLDVVHKFVRDVYYKRFPELESLVHLPLEYVRTVKVCSSFVLFKYCLKLYGVLRCFQIVLDYEYDFIIDDFFVDDM